MSAMERLSGMDAFFLYAETPTQHLHVTLCAVLDPAGMPDGYSFGAVRDHIAGRLHLVPPFTRKLQPMPMGIHHPVWVPATDFDLDQHVFRVAIPEPGGQVELAQLVAQVASTPLDRSKPLWELWIVEGLADDRIGLIAKLHHAAIDGVAGVEQMVNFFDLEREPEDAPPPAEPVDADAVEPTPLELAAYGIGFRARSIGELGGLLSRTVSSTLARLLLGTYSGRNLADRHTPPINVMISNVPGPPFPLYLAGAELERAYPMGQILEGVGCNITLMSYRHWIDVGIMAAANLLPDVEDLAARMEPAFAELAGAVGAQVAGGSSGAT